MGSLHIYILAGKLHLLFFPCRCLMVLRLRRRRSVLCGFNVGFGLAFFFNYSRACHQSLLRMESALELHIPMDVAVNSPCPYPHSRRPQRPRVLLRALEMSKLLLRRQMFAGHQVFGVLATVTLLLGGYNWTHRTVLHCLRDTKNLICMLVIVDYLPRYVRLDFAW